MTIAVRFNIQRGEFALNIDTVIPETGVTAIFGPSGSGKTTLLRAIAGLEHADNGYLKVGDALWQGNGVFLPTHQRKIGYVFQEPSLFSHLTVQGNINYGVARAKDE
jgi:molybdate transport system ATP-binding protein